MSWTWRMKLRMWIGWLRGGAVLIKGDNSYCVIRAGNMDTIFDIAADMMDEGWEIWKAPRVGVWKKGEVAE